MEVDYVESVRKRKDMMRTILEKHLEKDTPETKIMNLGCGSAREVRDIFSKDKQDKKAIKFTFLDLDKEALDYVKRQIDTLRNTSLSCNYLNENLLAFLVTVSKDPELYGEQDLIYSTGVADYLPDGFCERLIRAMYKLLKDDGKLVVAYKLVKSLKSLYSDWWCDWNFYERNEQEIMQVIQDGLEDNKFTTNLIYTIIFPRKSGHLEERMVA